MIKEEHLSLIEGYFNKQEAKEVLLNIISTKLQFHELKNLSSKERLGKPDEIALMRILVMRENINKVVELFSEINDLDFRIKISSSINIKVDYLK